MILVLGLTCLGLVFSLFVIDHNHFGFPVPLRSFARPGSVLFVLDFAAFDFSSSLRSFRSVGFALLVFGMICSELTQSLLDFVNIDLLILLRSVSKMDSVVFVLDLLHLGFSTFLHGYSQPGFLLLTAGLCRLGFVFSSLVLGVSTFDSSISVRSSGRLGLVVLVLDHSRFDFSLFSRGLAKPESAFLLAGISRPEVLILPLDLADMGPFLFTKSPACPGFLVSVPDFLHLGSSTSAQSSARIDLMLLLFGLS